MPDYVVSTEDLERVQAQLAVQLDQLVTAQVGVDAIVTELTDAVTGAVAAAQQRIEAQLGELDATLTRSRSLAGAARWTGPDSDQFRAGTEGLLATVEQTRDGLRAGVEAHRAGAAALRDEVDASSTAFEDAARALAESTALLEHAVAEEATGYERAFDGSFAHPGGAAPAVPPEGLPSGVPGFTLGPPHRPPVVNDDFWVYASREPSLVDYGDWADWWTLLQGAKLAMEDGAAFFDHYLGATGETLEFDFQEAVTEDEAIRANVNADLTRTAAAVDQLAQSGRTEFSVNTVSPTERPATQNWNFAIGDYQQSSSTSVRVEGDVVTMTTTVHADDRYNFHAGDSPGFAAPLNQGPGRLEEAGLARAFDSHGSITRTYSWKLGDPPPAIDVGG